MLELLDIQFVGSPLLPQVVLIRKELLVEKLVEEAILAFKEEIIV